MNKIIPFVLLAFFICGLFVPAFKPVLASSLLENSYNMKMPMQQARDSLGVVAVDGKIYAIGGYATGGIVGTNERYDPKTDTWATLALMPTSRSDFAIAAHQGKIYCIGGIVSKVSDDFIWWIVSDIICGVNEVYDTVTGNWSTKSSLPVDGSHLKAHVIDGQIFVLSGSDLYMYDPVVDSWTTKTSMPLPPRDANTLASTVIDDKIIVTGEFDYAKSRSVQKFMIYDPKIDMWTERNQENLPRVFSLVATGVTTGCYAPQKVYVFGTSGNTYIPIVSNQVYDPVSNAWSIGEDMPKHSGECGVVTIEDILYVIGGALNVQYVPIGYIVPVVDVVSPLNQTYKGSEVALSFTVDRYAVERSYCLDNQDCTTVIGNTTLSELTVGIHNVTVYARDMAGNIGTSETIVFTIVSKSPLSTTIITILVLTVGTIVTGLFFILKKKKRLRAMCPNKMIPRDVQRKDFTMRN